MLKINPAEVEREARAWTSDRKFASIDGSEVAYVERGAGEAALFLHGFPLNSFQWRGVVDRLRSVRRCIAPDLMGLGHTKVRPGQGVTPADQAGMLVGLLDRLEVDTVDLVSNDSGTGIAQLLAGHAPHRIRTMLLTNGEVEPDAPAPPLVPIIQLGKAGQFADAILLPSLADKAVMRAENGVAMLTYTDPNSLCDAAADHYFAVLVSSPERKALADAYLAAFEPNPLTGIEPLLRKCGVPTRIIWGMGDVIFSPNDPDYLDRILPQSRGVRRIPGAKTFFPEEYPDVVAEEARGLWAA